MGAIWRTIPAWIRDYSGMSADQLMTRVRSTFGKALLKIKRNSEAERRVRIEETLDMDIDNMSKRHIEFTEIHLNAAFEYQPGPYTGVVTVFRARSRGVNEVFFGSLDPEMGWGPLARGGVNVHLVDGYHRNMHISPYAGSLASELKKCLDAQA